MAIPCNYIKLIDVAESVGLHRGTLRRYIREGKLKAYKFGNKYYVRLDDYDRFVYERELKGLGVPEDKIEKFKELQLKEIKNENDEKMKAMFKLIGIDKVVSNYLGGKNDKL